MSSPLEVWGQRLALIGFACWIASIFLSWSSPRPAEMLVTGLEASGGALLVLGFIGWRKAMVQAGYRRGLLTQIVLFSRPLVARLVLTGSAMLVGIGVSGNHVSPAALAFAAMFFIVGLSLLTSDESVHRATR